MVWICHYHLFTPRIFLKNNKFKMIKWKHINCLASKFNSLNHLYDFGRIIFCRHTKVWCLLHFLRFHFLSFYRWHVNLAEQKQILNLLFWLAGAHSLFFGVSFQPGQTISHHWGDSLSAAILLFWSFSSILLKSVALISNRHNISRITLRSIEQNHGTNCFPGSEA